MWKEFKEFAFKGNVIDLAVGVMIGAAFGKIVTSVVNDIFMPLLSPLTGSLDFSSLFVAMDGNSYATLAKAQEAGAATLNYGAFITTVIDFLIIALCIFLFVRLISKLQRKESEVPAAPAEARKCPFCQSEISVLATRCPHCTSILNEVK
ncbi:MAG TPA: large conductance mechanosensitive channel protein MscL [Clostridia bacterium]|nr:MAG: Large-conductance mechanosensitive channel [Firmicutes bacterium ADurb.Bin356]HOF95275.1 large conductance mechanosensitive channel protein MscL [Clostridia bacterium]HOR12439.1 large conductance mechanosensitive channel protein MscL [Clostridia bacterium]